MKTPAPAHKGESQSDVPFIGPYIEPTDTAAALDGMPWERFLDDGEAPEHVIDALLQAIQADLKGWTGGAAHVLMDHGAKTITVESRVPAPEGTIVFKASVTLCINNLTSESEGRRLSVFPRIVAGTLLWKGRMPWLAEGTEEQFARNFQQIQDRLGALSLRIKPRKGRGPQEDP